MNAAELIEDYFVTPPGNIVLEESDRIDFKKIGDWDRIAMESRKADKKKAADEVNCIRFFNNLVFYRIHSCNSFLKRSNASFLNILASEVFHKK